MVVATSRKCGSFARVLTKTSKVEFGPGHFEKVRGSFRANADVKKYLNTLTFTFLRHLNPQSLPSPLILNSFPKTLPHLNLKNCPPSSPSLPMSALTSTSKRKLVSKSIDDGGGKRQDKEVTDYSPKSQSKVEELQVRSQWGKEVC